MRARFSTWAIASGSTGTPSVQALMGTLGDSLRGIALSLARRAFEATENSRY
jgi:hypothetical protein